MESKKRWVTPLGEVLLKQAIVFFLLLYFSTVLTPNKLDCLVLSIKRFEIARIEHRTSQSKAPKPTTKTVTTHRSLLNSLSVLIKAYETVRYYFLVTEQSPIRTSQCATLPNEKTNCFLFQRKVSFIEKLNELSFNLVQCRSTNQPTSTN